MRYPVSNLIISTMIVGASFLHPVISVVENEKQANVVSANSEMDDLFVHYDLTSFEDDQRRQYLPNSRLPINKNVITPDRKKNYKEYSLVASSGVVMDIKTKDVLYGKGLDDISSIASITKLMTALVFLDHSPDFDNIYEIKKSDRRDGGRIYLYNGDRVSVRDLFNLSLIPSANTATIALISAIGLSEEEFVVKMNQKVNELGLANTFYKDSTGLSRENVSTARDLAKLATIAFKNGEIRNVVKNREYSFATQAGRVRLAKSTNNLLETLDSDKFRLLGGKTGYNSEANYCFVALFRDRFENEVVSVVLGAEEINDRFRETEKMVEWVYDNYRWR